MAEFIRARSDEQKAQRLAQIKLAAERQFATHSYHEITLTTIAEELSWSRANLYKYVSTKEEIFLAITMDKRDAYMDGLAQAFDSDQTFSTKEIAQIWASLAKAHQDFFKYNSMLLNIIETNVSVEKLMVFKKTYHEKQDELVSRLSPVFGIDEAKVDRLTLGVMYHAEGLACSCLNNPLIKEALKRIGRKPKTIDFQAEMEEFIYAYLEGYRNPLP